VSERWRSLRLEEIEPIPVAGGLLWRPLRRTLGVEAFGVNAYVARAAGDDVVEEHTEEALRHEELYVVLSGRATFTLDGDTLDAPAGSVVFIRDPDVRRHARAEEPGTAVLAIGGRPGEPYTPSPWEWFFAAERYRESGDVESALALMHEALERFPDHAGTVYSLACWEAMAGKHDEALEHLQRAVELRPDIRVHAAQDPDLDAVRDDPRFPSA
jgi:tetratricopeptide (TPR) repeat protein